MTAIKSDFYLMRKSTAAITYKLWRAEGVKLSCVIFSRTDRMGLMRRSNYALAPRRNRRRRSAAAVAADT